MLLPTTHSEYVSHVSTHFIHNTDRPLFWDAVKSYSTSLSILLDMTFDLVRDALLALYCPTGQGAPIEPTAMLRSWLLMTLEREGSPTNWAERLTREPVLAILAGFTPGETPCATTHIDFLKRLADGPYAERKPQDVPLSQRLKGWCNRKLDDATKARREAADAAGKQQSEWLSETLLKHAEQPLNPHDLQTRLDHLFFELGLKPTLADGLLPSEVTGEGDGTAEPTGASRDGTRTCDCPSGSKCGCARNYTSETAQWCHDSRNTWVFGDRSYTISVHLNGHDFPLITIMPGGNESDFTLSLKALDRLLKMLEELNLPLRITVFVGDGHHDAMGIYRYLKEKGILPVIPLDDPLPPKKENAKAAAAAAEAAEAVNKTAATPADDITAQSNKTAKAIPDAKPLTPRPQVAMYPQINFEPDGIPLCPEGCKMRHHDYNSSRAAHIFVCPCMRKNGKQEWVFHADECPRHEDCTPPEKKMGHTLYIKSEADLRLFPPIPRDSKRFKDLYDHRSGSERQNSVADSYNINRRHRQAPYVLIRLTLVNICKHAVIREDERHPKMTKTARMHDVLAQMDLSLLLPN